MTRERLVSQGILRSVVEPVTDQAFERLLSRENILVAHVAMSDKVSAVYMRSDPYALVLVNRMHTIGHQRFSLAHELCHHHFHRDLNTWICTVELPSHDQREREANEFAAAFLLPAEGVGELFPRLMGELRDVSRAVLELCTYYRASWQSTVYRLFDLRLISAHERNELLELSVTFLAREVNADTELFAPGQQVKLPAEFTQVAQELLQRRVISERKFESIMDDLNALARCGEESPEVLRTGQQPGRRERKHHISRDQGM